MKEGVDFYFGRNQGADNGFRSVDYGIINCTIGGGMLEEGYIPTREIRETTIRGNPKPYFHGVDFKPMELNLTFGFESFHTGVAANDKDRALRELSYWLTKDYYVPFGIVGEDYMFYVMCVDDSRLVHNALSQGYVELTFRTDAPWAYSEIKTINLSGFNPDVETLIEFENNGDLDILPEIWIDIPFKTGGTNLECSITKVTGNFEEFKFTGLLSQEKLYVHNEKKYIESLNTTHYRYDNFNDKYLSLPRGLTQLSIKGIENLIFKYQERKYIAY